MIDVADSRIFHLSLLELLQVYRIVRGPGTTADKIYFHLHLTGPSTKVMVPNLVGVWKPA